MLQTDPADHNHGNAQADIDRALLTELGDDKIQQVTQQEHINEPHGGIDGKLRQGIRCEPACIDHQNRKNSTQQGGLIQPLGQADPAPDEGIQKRPKVNRCRGADQLAVVLSEIGCKGHAGDGLPVIPGSQKPCRHEEQLHGILAVFKEILQRHHPGCRVIPKAPVTDKQTAIMVAHNKQTGDAAHTRYTVYLFLVMHICSSIAHFRRGFLPIHHNSIQKYSCQWRFVCWFTADGIFRK